MAEDDGAEKKDGTERRVYNLPGNLLLRLRAFQTGQGISSEAEAVRRLLDSALQMRDTAADILTMLENRFASERDLRVLASETLTRHSLVTEINFDKGHLWFKLANGERGRIDVNGKLHYGAADESDDYFVNFVTKPPLRTVVRSGGGAPSWEPVGGNLDDEIPF